ncbi:MAG: hypothetical protein R2699_16740 [Acidimicrobiales bacterium]
MNPLVGGVRKVLPRRAAATVLKWGNAVGTQAVYRLSKTRPDLVKKALRKGLEQQLPKGFDIDTHFTPSYNPWDERPLRRGRRRPVQGHQRRAHRCGHRPHRPVHRDRHPYQSGRELTADIIVPATGLELLFIGGMELSVDGAPVDVSERLVYKGMMLEDTPNFAVAVGYTNASWTLKADLTFDAVCRLLNTMRGGGMRQCTPTNVGGEVEPAPLLGLQSGYIQRSADRFPSGATASRGRCAELPARLQAMRLQPPVRPAWSCPTRCAT